MTLAPKPSEFPLMTAQEFKAAVKTLGTYVQAAKLLDRSPGMIKQYAGGHARVTEEVEQKLVAALQALPMTIGATEEDVLEAQAERVPREPPSALTEVVRRKIRSSTLEEGVREELEARIVELEAENLWLRTEVEPLSEEIDRLKAENQRLRGLKRPPSSLDEASPPLPPSSFTQVDRRGLGPKSSLSGSFTPSKR